jgi:hypothetical protein
MEAEPWPPLLDQLRRGHRRVQHPTRLVSMLQRSPDAREIETKSSGPGAANPERTLLLPRSRRPSVGISSTSRTVFADFGVTVGPPVELLPDANQAGVEVDVCPTSARAPLRA